MPKDIKSALKIINSFYQEELTFKGSEEKLLELEKQRNIQFPDEFKTYIKEFLPSTFLDSTTIGNSINFYDRKYMSWKMEGYNYNKLEEKEIEDWDKNWFIFANEGGDPFIIKLDEKEKFSKVYKACHGENSWDFFEVADSIGDFLLSAFALSHALIGFEQEDYIIDDENGFNLVEENANWFFPFVIKHIPKYYDEWTQVFDNA